MKPSYKQSDFFKTKFGKQVLEQLLAKPDEVPDEQWKFFAEKNPGLVVPYRGESLVCHQGKYYKVRTGKIKPGDWLTF